MNDLSFEKIWEDADFYEVRIFVRTDCAQVNTTTYITPEAIGKLAGGLKDFPRMQDDRFYWENGERGNASMPFISLEFWCKDWRGHVEIKIYLEFADDDIANGYHCYFALSAEVGQLSDFGRALLRLNRPGIGTEIKLGDRGHGEDTEDTGTVLLS